MSLKTLDSIGFSLTRIKSLFLEQSLSDNCKMFRMGESGSCLCVLLIFGLFDRSMSEINDTPKRISCVESGKTKTCYDAFISPATWSAAWIGCAAKGGQLALPKTPEISTLFGAFVEQYSFDKEDDTPVWIGGRELNSPDWQWIGGKNFETSSVPPKTVVNLTNLTRPFETCATLSSNASSIIFQSVQCRGSASFICQSAYNSTPASTTCQIGPHSGVVRGDSCYAAVSTVPKRSWFKARHECMEHGADLAVFNESSDQAIIRAVLSSYGQTAFWIGLIRYPWVWATDYNPESDKIDQWQEMTHFLWGSPSPSYSQRSCLAMVGKGGMDHEWTNLRCNETHPYICQQTTILTTAPPANMNDTPEDVSGDSNRSKIVSILVPCSIVAGILIIIGFSTYCYFSKRKGYVQH